MKRYILYTPEHSSRLDYQADLNPQQLTVVTAGEGPILVVAGAGSGKTRTLTYRVAHLIDCGVPPSRIALCTFTNRAAREMISRVEKLVAGNVRQVWGGTFHHLANRVLREFSPRVGYSEGYSILDREDCRELLAYCVAEYEKKDVALRRPTAVLLPNPEVLGELISYAANTQTALDQVILKRLPSLINLLDELLPIACSYRDRKLKINAMDFDDLLTNLKTLLCEHPGVAEEVSERFWHVLVDEYQDTNVLQCDIVDLLARVHGNLTVVGDDAQSIYGFRGANPNNMLFFKDRWPGAELYKLETNYRSTPEILSVANLSIKHNRFQLPKELVPTRGSGPLPAMIPVRDDEVQATLVAQRVIELSGEGIPLRDMAVLYRAHHHSLELQVELTRRRIPYIVRSGVRFFEQAHIKDVLAHLRILENPRDELSWIRVVKLQPGIGRTGALRVWEKVKESSNPLEAALDLPNARLPQRSRSGWTRLQNLLRKLVGSERRTSVLISTLMDHGYRELLSALYSNPENRQDDIEQLARYSDHFESPRVFLSELNMLSGFTSEEVLVANRTDEAITLSTVHQAKGLEWKVVFVISLNEGYFPHPRAIMETQGDDEEERRIFHVAVTRTKDELYLINMLVSDRPGRRRGLLKPSRFIEEIANEDCLERWSVEELQKNLLT